MKKIISLYLVLVLCVFQLMFFSACGNGNNEQSGEETPETNFVCFGSYPQKDVTKEKGEEFAEYAENLPANGNDNGWTSYKYYLSGSNDADYMWYKDIDLDNDGKNDYRGVYFTEYRPDWTDESKSSAYQNQNGYYKKSVYWFEFEPIKWKILENKDGKAFLLAALIIDSQDYNHVYNRETKDGKMLYGNNYAYSSVRAWLNNDFYNAAFTETEKILIDVVEVDNSLLSTIPNRGSGAYDGKYTCDNTNDRVFLLSVEEVTKNEYGFSSSLTLGDKKRQKHASDYAKIQGTAAIDSDYGYWWLRSPSVFDTKGEGDSAFFISPNGGDDYRYARVHCTPCGIAPAMWISLI